MRFLYVCSSYEDGQCEVINKLDEQQYGLSRFCFTYPPSEPSDDKTTDKEIEYDICEKQEEMVVCEACYGHCCTHGGYGNTEW